MNKMRICSRLVLVGMALGLALAGCVETDVPIISDIAVITALTLTIGSQDYTIDFYRSYFTDGMTAKVGLPEGTTMPSTATVKSVTLSPGASGLAQNDPVSINASGEASIKITAEDGTTTQDYTVTVKVMESLSNYSLSYPMAKHSAAGNISASPIWKKGSADKAPDPGRVGYSIDPALPTGLILDSAHGTIFGTVSTMLSLEKVTEYQITVTGNNFDYEGTKTGIFLDKFLLGEYSQVAPATGTAISNIAKLKAMVTEVSSDPSGEYYLTAHIDLTGETWTPIASSATPFTGKLHGNGYAIYNLNIDAETATHQGLFASVSGATIDNLSIGVSNIKGKAVVGALASVASNNATLSNIAVAPMTADAKIEAIGTETIGLAGLASGSLLGGLVGYLENCTLTAHSQVTVKGAGNEVGGLVGHGRKISGGDVFVISGYATGDVSGANTVGGLVGNSFNVSFVSGYATGDVSGNSYVGGLVGDVYGSPVIGYATGDVSGVLLAFGGLIGSNNSTCVGYATGDITGTNSSVNFGGLVGNNGADRLVSGYWDKQSTGQDTSAGGATAVGISATKNIVFTSGIFTSGTGYTDSGNSGSAIFDNTTFTAIFNTANGADKTWPKLKSSFTYSGTDYNFDFPQPTVTVSASDDNIIEVTY